jgi:O-antigen/teichoic acid export membrane protein
MSVVTDAERVMPHTVRDRIRKALAAGGFGQAVTVVVQLVSVPLFIHYWGVDRYGEWLLLAAVPSYLALSDLGFGSAAANEMTMSAAAGDRERVVSTYQSAWALLGLISIAVIALLFVLGFGASQGAWLGIRTLSKSDIFWTVLLLGVGVCVSLQGGIISAIYRCEGRFATGVMLSNAMRLIEFSAVAGAIVVGAGVVTVAATMLTARVIGMATIYALAQSFAPWAKLGFRHARVARIKALASPALSFTAFPLGNAINLQGFSLIVGTQLGAAALVVFSTMRTISRVASQAMNLINSSVWPEMSSAFGRNDVPAAREIHRRACQASIAVGISALIILATGGDRLLNFWTNGKVLMDYPSYQILLGGLAVNVVWFTSSVVPASVNRHQRMALAYLAASICGLLLALVLTRAYGLSGAASAALLVEGVMVIAVLPKSLMLTQDRTGDFLKSMFSVPAYLKPG